jgi:hypothetical protein
LRDALLEDVIKVGLITGFISLVLWVQVYTKLTKGGAWRNPLGLTFIIKSLLLAALFMVVALSTFVNLGPRTSQIVGWVDAVLIGSVTPVMLWRTVVFLRLDRTGKLLALHHLDVQRRETPEVSEPREEQGA